jgi:cobalt-zinc-cadmium efflux system outer membrane protein
LPAATAIGDFAERSIGIRQQIGWPVAWWRRKQAADLQAEGVRWSALAMSELEIAARARIAYDRVRSGRQILGYEKEHLQLARDFLKKARLRFEAGDVPQLEVLRAGVAAGRAEVRVAARHNALASARGALNTLMAREVGAELETVGTLEYQTIILDLDQLKQQALVRRPDLLAVERLALARRALQGAARAALVPDLSVGLARQTVRQPGGDESLWRVDVGLEIPLSLPFSRRGELAEARAEVARAEAEVEVMRRQVQLEVEDALRDVQTTSRQLELFQRDVLREAEMALKMANRSYAEGKATYLEVLETQRALAETRVEYAQALLAYSVAQTELARATGRFE